MTLAAERPLVHVVATDLSAEALAVAQQNVSKHAVAERVTLREGDLFDAIEEGAQFELVVANPPYILESELPGLAPELQHEPALALTSGAQGLDVLARLCAEVGRYLVPGGTALFEVGAGQASQVAALMRSNPELTGITSHRALGGLERVVECRRVGGPAPSPEPGETAP